MATLAEYIPSRKHPNYVNPGAVGRKNGSGRKKGVPNRFSTSMRMVILEAFHKRGGVGALVDWANENPTEFYKICARLIPVEVVGPDGGALVIVTRAE